MAREEPPFKASNSDGRPNLGSYEVGGALGVVRTVHWLWLQHRPELSPPRGKIRYAARTLLKAVDETQHNVVGRTDRMAGSHNRAYRAVRTALDVHPIPWDATEQEREGWYRRLVDHATQLYALAAELVHGENFTSSRPDPSR